MTRVCEPGAKFYVYFLLQSERFLVEAIVVFDFVQSLLLERSFDPMQNVVHVVLLRPEERKKVQSPVSPSFGFIISIVEAEALASKV